MGFFSKKQSPQPVQEEILEPQVEEIQEEESQVPDVPQESEQTEIVNTFSDEMGIIASGTTIHGDIKTNGHLAIVGIVEGNISASGNVMLTGIVKGNIDCNNIIIDSTDYSQCIRAKGSVSVKPDTTISGLIYCKHISISGSVFGDIRAQGNVGLTKEAIVKGNITSSILAVEPGAKLVGNVTVR